MQNIFKLIKTRTLKEYRIVKLQDAMRELIADKTLFDLKIPETTRQSLLKVISKELKQLLK